jgi:hypothetical protein
VIGGLALEGIVVGAGQLAPVLLARAGQGRARRAWPERLDQLPASQGGITAARAVPI